MRHHSLRRDGKRTAAEVSTICSNPYALYHTSSRYFIRFCSQEHLYNLNPIPKMYFSLPALLAATLFAYSCLANPVPATQGKPASFWALSGTTNHGTTVSPSELKIFEGPEYAWSCMRCMCSSLSLLLSSHQPFTDITSNHTQ